MWPFFRICIPSRAPREYRSNHGTPIAAYLALFTLMHRLQKQADRQLNIPTRVFIDCSDGLVPYSKIRSLVAEKELSHWRIVPLRKKNQDHLPPFHHLIIDEKSAGEETWATISGKIHEFLVG